jgi:hypothetical protein
VDYQEDHMTPLAPHLKKITVHQLKDCLADVYAFCSEATANLVSAAEWGIGVAINGYEETISRQLKSLNGFLRSHIYWQEKKFQSSVRLH